MFDGEYEIRRAGINANGQAMLDMQTVAGGGTAFPFTWVYSTPERAREILAVALTALAANKRVGGVVNNDVNPYVVDHLYLVK
jgi:hypothetical protein